MLLADPELPTRDRLSHAHSGTMRHTMRRGQVTRELLTCDRLSHAHSGRVQHTMRRGQVTRELLTRDRLSHAHSGGCVRRGGSTVTAHGAGA
jgi:hypothetical protein